MDTRRRWVDNLYCWYDYIDCILSIDLQTSVGGVALRESLYMERVLKVLVLPIKQSKITTSEFHLCR